MVKIKYVTQSIKKRCETACVPRMRRRHDIEFGSVFISTILFCTIFVHKKKWETCYPVIQLTTKFALRCIYMQFTPKEYLFNELDWTRLECNM